VQEGSLIIYLLLPWQLRQFSLRHESIPPSDENKWESVATKGPRNLLQSLPDERIVWRTKNDKWRIVRYQRSQRLQHLNIDREASVKSRLPSMLVYELTFWINNRVLIISRWGRDGRKYPEVSLPPRTIIGRLKDGKLIRTGRRGPLDWSRSSGKIIERFAFDIGKGRAIEFLLSGVTLNRYQNSAKWR